MIEQPYSNGVWYDVGNHDGVFIWVLNSADARVYNNTFVDTPASFERTGRSAAGDHFGWHPSTGPGVDQRQGHVFVNNLLVASQAYRGPLLRFEQPPSLCAQLPRPQANQVDGNLYVRATVPAAAAATPSPLIVWSPAAAGNCISRRGSLDEFRKLVPAFEASGRQLDRTPRSIFKAPDLGRYDLLQPLPQTPAGEMLPADVRHLLGWSEEEARSPGAYPFRR